MRQSKRLMFFAVLFVVSGSAFAAMFEPLFTAVRVVGDVRIVRPDGSEAQLKEDFSYPYGSRIIVPPKPTEEELKKFKRHPELAPATDPEVMVSFSSDFRFRFSAGTDVKITDASVGGAEAKMLDLSSGMVSTYITAASTKTGNEASDAAVAANLAATIIRTPVGECTQLADRNKVQVIPDAAKPGFFNVMFATQGGGMEITGPQYKINKMRSGSAVRIGGNKDNTHIATEAGEFTVTFEKGADNNEMYVFRSGHFAKILRQYAEIGKRMAVSVIVSRNRDLLSNYSYLEGQTNVGMGSSTAAELGGEHSALGAETPAETSGTESGDAFGSFDEGDSAGDAGDSSDWGSESSDSGASDFSDWDF